MPETPPTKVERPKQPMPRARAVLATPSATAPPMAPETPPRTTALAKPPTSKGPPEAACWSAFCQPEMIAPVSAPPSTGPHAAVSTVPSTMPPTMYCQLSAR